MSAFYAEKWSSRFGDVFGEAGVVGAAWRAGLTGVTPSEIEGGFRALLDREDPWPPGVVEFKQLCRPMPEDHSQDWKSAKANPAMKPSAERLAWHQANIECIKAGNELPRPGSVEPPAPAGSPDFWEIYNRVFQS